MSAISLIFNLLFFKLGKALVQPIAKSGGTNLPSMLD